MTIAALLRRWGPLAFGSILIIVGLAMASEPLTFGWFGYADGGIYTQFSPQLIVMPTAAAVVLGVGIMVIAGWAGFLLGGRRRRRASAETQPRT